MKKLLMIVLILCLAACSGTKQQKTTQALTSTGEVVKELFIAADQACAESKLTQDQCTKLATLYTKTRSAYYMALDSLDAAIRAGDSETAWEKYACFHAKFEDLYRELLTLSGKSGLMEEKK